MSWFFWQPSPSHQYLATSWLIQGIKSCALPLFNGNITSISSHKKAMKFKILFLIFGDSSYYLSFSISRSWPCWFLILCRQDFSSPSFLLWLLFNLQLVMESLFKPLVTTNDSQHSTLCMTADWRSCSWYGGCWREEVQARLRLM